MADIVARLFRPPRGSYFLFGPRGSGKSTWLRQLHPDAHWIDLLDEGIFQGYLVDPSSLSNELDALDEGTRVVIDEVQRLPSLLNVVHQKIEQKRLRFSLSGSSARKLRRGGVNLLAGRAVLRRLHAYLPEELGKSFRLADALETGTLPIIHSSEDPRDSLSSYVQLYLKEEIQAEAATRNLAGFARFLSIVALFHGQSLNVSSLARDAGVARTTVQGYLQILDDTLLSFRLPAYETRLRVREKRHPKLYWVDPGLVRTIAGSYGPPGPDQIGPLFEGFIAQCLRAYDDYHGLYDTIAYWSPAQARQTEVHFLLRRGGRFVAIEAKATRRWRPDLAKGLRAISELAGIDRRIVVYMGSRALRPEPGIEVLPVVEFLEQASAGL